MFLILSNRMVTRNPGTMHSICRQRRRGHWHSRGWRVAAAWKPCCHIQGTSYIQWSLHFKTYHLARKIWSWIEGLKMEGLLYWKCNSGNIDDWSWNAEGFLNRGVLNYRYHCTGTTVFNILGNMGTKILSGAVFVFQLFLPYASMQLKGRLEPAMHRQVMLTILHFSELHSDVLHTGINMHVDVYWHV